MKLSLGSSFSFVFTRFVKHRRGLPVHVAVYGFFIVAVVAFLLPGLFSTRRNTCVRRERYVVIVSLPDLVTHLTIFKSQT